jgi:hypothetical protein
MRRTVLLESVASLAVAAVLAIGGCAGGGSGGGGPCQPSCAGRSCGPDGCGGSCGGCDDGNPCTTDACTGGACTHAAVADTATCEGLFFTGCEAGAPLSVDCRDVCYARGDDTAYGCGFPGASQDSCTCGNQTTTCTSTGDWCYTATIQAGCDAATDEWYAVDCDGLCRSLGWEGSTGCRAQVQYCTCWGYTTINGQRYACGGYGADCGGTKLCCGNLACTWHYNGGNSYNSCVESTPCDPACVVGSVCCGGAFCAGDCIGSPCCR